MSSPAMARKSHTGIGRAAHAVVVQRGYFIFASRRSLVRRYRSFFGRLLSV